MSDISDQHSDQYDDLIFDDMRQTDELLDRDPEVHPDLRDQWMRMGFAAQLLGVNVTTIYRRVMQGKLTSWRPVSFLILVSRPEILAWEQEKRGRKPGRRFHFDNSITK